MALTAIQARNAKPAEKQYKLADEKGMYLLVKPNGRRYWRMDYRFAGKRKTMALGTYEDVSLREAREKRDEARRLISQDIDPSRHKQRVKQQHRETASNSLQAIATEWHEAQSSTWSANHAKRVWGRLEKSSCPIWVPVPLLT